MAFEEVAYGQQEDEETGDADTAEEVELGPGITRIATADQCQDICNSTLCLAFVHQLKALAAVSIRKCSTAGCEHVPAVKEGFTGSALYLRWVRTFYFLLTCEAKVSLCTHLVHLSVWPFIR